jgi:hypothetical protein
MKKVLLFISCLYATVGIAQLRQSAMDSIFMNLNPTYINTGVLFDKAYHFSAMERYTGLNDTIITWQDWKQLYAELYNMYWDHSKLPSLNSLKDNLEAKRSTGVTPLLIINCAYNTLKPDADERGLITIVNEQLYDQLPRAESPYTQSRVFAVAPAVQKSDTTAYKFYIGTEFYFNNDKTELTNFQIDFGDGKGYQSVAFGQTISVNYTSRSTTDRILKLRTQEGNLLLYSSAKISGSTCNGNYPAYDVANVSIATIPYNGEYGKAYTWVKFGKGNTTGVIQKPVIFVEGIDFEKSFSYAEGRYGSFGWCQLWGADYDPGNATAGYPEMRNMPTFLNALLDKGFDIVLFDFMDGAGYIQKNAFTLVKFLNELYTEGIAPNRQPAQL